MKRSLLSFFFILFGLSLLSTSIYFSWLRVTPTRISFQQVQAQSTVRKQEILPLTLIIPSVTINLPIIPARIVNNTWETTENGVSYLASSPLPGSTGNSVFYGHNWPNLLGNLTRTKPGDKVFIVLSSGERRSFTVEYTAEVNPTDVGILSPSRDKRITLYTCSGFLDSKRFVVVALLDAETNQN